MENISNITYGVIVMVLVQIAMAALNVFYKLAAYNGMSLKVMVAYRFLFAAAFMVPLAAFVERNKRPKLTGKIVGQAFLCALLGGSLAQNLYAETLVLTSATFASAMTNLIPILTFIFALFFGMEILDMRTLPGKAKVVGILISLGGAMLLTLYKGSEIVIWSTHVDLVQDHSNHSNSRKHFGNQALGSLLAAIGSCFVALSTIIQAKMSERYPCPYSSTALIALMGSFQAVVFALFAERDRSQWKLGWDIRLLSVAYAGIVASGITVIFIMWCIHIRGPLFVSIFCPLMLVFTALAGSLILNEKLHLGSVLGCILIIWGLYMVLWGKAKDLQKIAQIPSKDNKLSQFYNIHILVSSENGNEVTATVLRSSSNTNTNASNEELP
ncbi:hypothetical protein ACH5RR_001957 [Cinchona calisaya]|uniref:WAT1-related protein n=1 Tax=Cinchona calisaya TaxID=153742 RepID=A0ABD3B561_9GENT